MGCHFLLQSYGINTFNFTVHRIVPSLQRWSNSCIMSEKQYETFCFSPSISCVFYFPCVISFLLCMSDSTQNIPLHCCPITLHILNGLERKVKLATTFCCGFPNYKKRTESLIWDFLQTHLPGWTILTKMLILMVTK